MKRVCQNTSFVVNYSPLPKRFVLIYPFTGYVQISNNKLQNHELCSANEWSHLCVLLIAGTVQDFKVFCLVKFAFGSETISYPEPSQTSWAYAIRARKGLGMRLAVKEFTIIQTSSLSPPVLWRHICLLDFAARQTQAPNDLCVQSNKGNPNFTLISQMVQDSRQTNLTKRPHAKLQH